jgi:hypothetical protein
MIIYGCMTSRALKPLGVCLVALCVVAAPAPAAWYFDGPAYTDFAGGRVSESVRLVHAVGDLNGDDVPDVVVPALWDWVGLYLGVGDGTFQPAQLVPCPARAQFVAIADFDGDGAQDIAHSNLSSAGVIFGDGTGHGWSGQWYPLLGFSGTYVGLGLATGDFDEDGRCDLVVPKLGGLETWLSRPGRAFVRLDQPVDSLGVIATRTRVADMDADGHADVVVAMELRSLGEPEIVVLYGRGDGSFQPVSVHLSPYEAEDVDIADVTGDGILDLVTPRWGDGALVTPGLGGRTFGASVSVLPGGYQQVKTVAAGDFTGDGIVDLVMATGLELELLTLPGLGGGAFGPVCASKLAIRSYPLLDVDLNADERLDIVSLVMGEAYVGASMVACLGNGDGTFGVPTLDFDIPSSRSVVAGRLDGDSLPDLVMTGGPSAGPGVHVRLARPGRAFVEAPSPVVGPRAADWYALGIREMTGDGYGDLVLWTSEPRALVLPGLGDGTFSPGLPSAVYPGSSLPKLADADGDGVADLLCRRADTLRVLRGLGDGTFAPPVDSPGHSSSTLLWGDVDGDGLLDAFQETGVSKGLGGGPFGPPEPGSATPGAGVEYIGDVDGDGRQDLVLNGVPDPWNCTVFCVRVYVRLQRPDGSFGPPIESVWNTDQSVLHMADMDQDGHADMIMTALAFAKGDGAGRFGSYGGVMRGDGCPVPAGSLIADLDLDGRLDAVAQPLFGRFSVVWGREPVAPEVAWVGPVVPQVMVAGGAVDLTWSAWDAGGIASADLFVSRHGASGPYERIAAGLGDTGGYRWTVTGPVSDSVTFKVVARDSARNVAHALSADLLRIVGGATDVSAGGAARLALGPVQPNPARARVAVGFTLPAAGAVTLEVLDVRGRRVAAPLEQAWRAAGPQTVGIGTGALAPGVYFVRLGYAGERRTARLAVVR